MARIIVLAAFLLVLPALINILNGGPVKVGDQPLGLSPSDEWAKFRFQFGVPTIS
jgi:hypothetical protein